MDQQKDNFLSAILSKIAASPEKMDRLNVLLWAGIVNQMTSTHMFTL